MTTTPTNWMDPLNKIIWKKAIRASETEVTLRDGSVYTLEYRAFHDRLDGKLVPKVWISPKDPNKYAPCGWFIVKKMLNGAYD